MKNKENQILKCKQKRTSLELELPDGSQWDLKLSVRVFRRFLTSVIKYMDEILLDSPKSFRDYYLSILTTYLRTKDCRLILNEEFIYTVTNQVDVWLDKNRHRFQSSINKEKEGALNAEQLFSLFKVSFYLKMFSLFIYTNAGMIEDDQKVLFKRITKLLRENQVDAFLFEFVRLKFLSRAGHSFWTWISSSKFQDISYHITNTYYTILSQILLQLIEGYNPIAFIKGVVENTMYYLFTDIYLDEVKYMEQESKKLRFVKSYSLIEKHVLKSAYEQIINTVKANLGHINVQRTSTQNHKPVFHFLTLPLMTKILKVPYIYFYSLKDIYYLNLYTSLLLEKIIPQLTTLRKICRSYGVLKSTKQRVSSQVLEPLKPLYNVEHALQSVYQETLVFDSAAKQILSYDFWDMLLHTPVEYSSNRLIDELKVFYEKLILSDRYSIVFDAIKRHGFELPNDFTMTFLS